MPAVPQDDRGEGMTSRREARRCNGGGDQGLLLIYSVGRHLHARRGVLAKRQLGRCHHTIGLRLQIEVDRGLVGQGQYRIKNQRPE